MWYCDFDFVSMNVCVWSVDFYVDVGGCKMWNVNVECEIK